MGTTSKKTIDDDVMTVLKNSTITGTTLKLPPGQLERKLYDRVNKILVVAGGKWNRSSAAHVFQSDPRELLGMAMEQGHIVDKKVQYQQFFTPPSIAKLAVDELLYDKEPLGLRVIEPSCGSGNMLAALFDRGIAVAQLHAVEIDPVLVEQTRQRFPAMKVVQYDYLQQASVEPDLVLMNPPFQNQQDIDHVTHALGHLKPGGRLVAIMSPSYEFTTNKKAVAFRELIEEHRYRKCDLPEGSFKESGTGVATIMLVINKY